MLDQNLGPDSEKLPFWAISRTRSTSEIVIDVQTTDISKQGNVKQFKFLGRLKESRAPETTSETEGFRNLRNLELKEACRDFERLEKT